MNIAVAFDSFKGSVSGREASCRVAAAISSLYGYSAFALPLADGGEGTARALLSLCGGKTAAVPVPDAFGNPVEAEVVLLADGTAALDMACCCGLGDAEGTSRARVMEASSFGLGIMVRTIQRRFSPRRIIIGLGGSASCDGGTGFLKGLGATITFYGEQPLFPAARHLGRITAVDLRSVAPLPELLFLCDVDAPLCGDNGAARRFAPQKGATPQQVEQIESSMRRWCSLSALSANADPATLCNAPGAGAAGGMGLAAALIGAPLIPGAPFICGKLKPLLRDADLVITGEGRTDISSLQGKAPCALARTAININLPTWLFSGSIALDTDTLHHAGFVRSFPLITHPPRPYDLNTKVTLRRLIYACCSELLRSAKR